MKISLSQQIEGLYLALSMLGTAGGGVKKLGHADLNFQRARLQAALNTLVWLQSNIEAVRAAIAKARGTSAASGPAEPEGV